MPDPILESAYLATDYWVESPTARFAIRIGEPCPQIDAGSWAYVTACNPGSRLLAPEENAARMRQLEADVRAAGFSFWRGEGVGPGEWPPEPSLLILNIDEESAVALARRYEQAAIVCGAAGEVARLVWLEG